jgi:hypothetical protein
VSARNTIIAVLATAFAAGSALAQPPAGMPQLTPQQQAQMQAKMKAWRDWNDKHKNIQAVGRTLRGIEELQKDPKTKLNKKQAQSVLGVLKTWRNKPTMTDAQALQVNKQLTASLSLTQIKKLATMSQRRRPGGGAGMGAPRTGNGGQGPSGGPGRMPRFDPSKMPGPKDYNPLNPKTLPFERMRPRATESLDALMKSLAATK